MSIVGWVLLGFVVVTFIAATAEMLVAPHRHRWAAVFAATVVVGSFVSLAAALT